MQERRLLLQISHGDNSMSVYGVAAEIGDFPTRLRVRSPLRGLRVSILGASEGAKEVHQLAAPLLAEHARYDIYLRGPSPGTFGAEPKAEVARLLFSASDTSHYTLSYGSAVGDVTWNWRTPAGEVEVDLEVFPTKLDYRQDFMSIKDDLRRLSRVLIADIAGAAGSGFASLSSPQETQLEWVEQLRREASALVSAMAALLPGLRQQVRPVELVIPADRLRGRKPARRRDHGLIALGIGPRTVTACSVDLTTATAVNGHLRWEVDRFVATAQQVLLRPWLKASEGPLLNVVTETLSAARSWQRSIGDIPAVPHLPHLQSRLRDPLYARAFGSLRRLRLGLEEAEAPELLGLKDIWLLYEYWVYLQLITLLRQRYPVVTAASPSLVREAGGQIHLVKGIESRIRLSDGAGNSVSCCYNRSYVNLATTGQRPDITIELPSGRLVLVDAKYRLGRSARYLERYGMPGPEEDDINVMHRYRDAITGLAGERLVAGGVIAFPGPQEEQYRQHHFFKSWARAQIAGFPMLPGRTTLVAENLIEQLPGETRSPR